MRGLLKLNKGQGKVLPRGGNNPLHQYMLGARPLESSSAEETLQVLTAAKLKMRQHCALGSISMSVASRSGRRSCPSPQQW